MFKSLPYLFVVLLSFSLPLTAHANLPEDVPAKSAPDVLSTDLHIDDLSTIHSRLPSFPVPFANVPANVSYIPANMSKKPREAIYETQPKMFQESVKELEGAVLYDEVGNNIDSTFSLRGFNTSSAVIFLVDGVRVNNVDGDSMAFPLIDLSDVDAIQVDRGSSSPIFGSNAFGGVVHITTGRPSDKKVSVFGGFEYSSFDGFRFHKGVSGTLPDDITGLGGMFKYYFKGGHNRSDGFRPNGEYDITNFDAKASYELPDDQGRVYFGWKHVDGSISNPGSLLFDDFQENEDRTIKPRDGRDRDNTIIQVGGDKKFLDDRLMLSVLASQRYDRNRFTTTYATFSSFGEPRPDTDFLTKKSRTTDLVWQAAYKEEFKKLSSLSIIGMDMRTGDESNLLRDAFLGGTEGPLAPNNDRYARPKSQSLFWRQTLNYDNILIVHFGMRHDWHSVRINDNITPTNNVSDRWNKSTLSTGVTVRPATFLDLFFNYSQGFRVPTLSEMVSPSAFGVSIATGLAPVTSDSYEVGTRIRLKDKGIAKASFFVIDLQDEIVFDSNSVTALAPFGQNTNASASRRMGFETRVDLQPIDELSLYGSYTWTKAYIRETDPAQPATGIPSLADGRSLGLVPEHRITVGVVARPLKRFGEHFEKLKVGLHGVFTGKQHPASYESASAATLAATGGPGHIIKSYSVWDFIMSYAIKDYEVYFKINNIFDNKYISRSVNATSFGSGLVPAGRFNFVNSGPPREFLVGARWQWGKA